MIDVYVYRVRLPDKLYEMVTPNREDDGYTIYIDDRLNDEQAQKELLNALIHAQENHFACDDVQKIEEGTRAAIL